MLLSEDHETRFIEELFFAAFSSRRNKGGDQISDEEKNDHHLFHQKLFILYLSIIRSSNRRCLFFQMTSMDPETIATLAVIAGAGIILFHTKVSVDWDMV